MHYGDVVDDGLKTPPCILLYLDSTSSLSGLCFFHISIGFDHLWYHTKTPPHLHPFSSNMPPPPCPPISVSPVVLRGLQSRSSSDADLHHLKETALQLRSSSSSENGFRDLVPLPRPLSMTDLVPQPSHGSQFRVAYQGVPGAYSEMAAERAYPNCEAVPCEQFEGAFQAVEHWVVDRAVLPIENSLGGSIHRNYDLLLRHRLHIVGEVQLSVHHCLLGLPGVKKEELRRVLSHPQALAQCENTLTKLNVIREAVDDTAGAAQFIADNYLRDTGAVASARAAEIYGLEVLLDGIQDDADNVTRFLMLAREPIIPRSDRPFKTSITFTLDEGPGVLFKALGVFALREINLTKIESRPLRKRPLRVVDGNNGITKSVYFDYLFFVDFEASMADQRAQNALRHLQEFATFLRVLGSYPMDVTCNKPSQVPS